MRPTAPIPLNIPGVFHTVERGQTLWRISKLYNTDLDEIARVNRITDTTSIEVGQQILIPYAKKPEVPFVSNPSEDFIWPLQGKIISSFGQTSNNLINKGINIQPFGSMDVVASRSGKVVFYSDNFGAFGKTLIIDHGDGISTVYSRNADVFVKPGDLVQKGGLIAKAGSCGRDKNIYLHFEIRKKHLAQNPNYYLP